MKNFLVVIELIMGYYKDEFGNQDYDSPITKRVEYKVEANSETEAISAAKNLDQSKLSVWDSYAEEIEALSKIS